MFKNILSDRRRWAMRYAKQHKQITRQQIIDSARRLFAAQGFAATSIDAVMQECGLTRGGFYAHFKSKGELYREVMSEFGVAPESAGTEWIDSLFEQAVQLDRQNTSYLAFLATDVATADPDVRRAYAAAVQAMSERIRASAKSLFSTASENEDVVLSLTAMMIGAVAISQTVDDDALKSKLLTACRDTARRIAHDVNEPAALLWEGALLGSLQRRLQLAAL
jgi:TetR/AcrR family transcriptional repressor of nem operon